MRKPGANGCSGSSTTTAATARTAGLKPAAAGEAVGLSRDDLLSERHVLPGVRFAVDAYLNFARRACWQEAACSSLTELFAPQIHQSRLDSWPQHYPWIKEEGYFYFRSRLSQPIATLSMARAGEGLLRQR